MINNVEKKYHPISNKFNNYKMVKNNITYYVPLDSANTDYQAIQEWISKGGEVIDNPPTE
jgi:hypothetical protein